MVQAEKLIYEIHFFKPPAQSFVNFSNFASIGKDVSDVRTDIAWITTSFSNSTHAMMCKTFAGLRATYPIKTDDGKILGGLSVGKKIDWLPKSVKDFSNSDAFLVYNSSATQSLLPKYYDDFMQDKQLVGKFILADKTIAISKEEMAIIDFTKPIQDITISNHRYSLNIFPIVDFDKDKLAYLCMLNDIDVIQNRFLISLVKNLVLLIIVTVIIYLLLHNRAIELEKEKNYVKKLLDLTPDIILVTNAERLISANQRFFDFVHYETLEEFLKNHDCICDYFVSVDNVPFPKDKTIDGQLWSKYILEHNDKIFTATIDIDSQLFYFNIKATNIDQYDVLITLQNITEIKRKDQLLFEQSKMASMGEMIGNIAHQWRQPLSVISTAATGLQLQKEHGILTDQLFDEECSMINKNAQFLSKTIDVFRNFIKGDRKLLKFSLEENINSFLHLIEGSLKAYNIQIVFDLDQSIVINGYPNELIQCSINIFNNAKDIFVEKKLSNPIFKISTLQHNDSVQILFEDNGGGIDETIVSNIFEPYFTTKHKSQGTGLGLSMTYQLIVEGMGGNIEASNTKLKYDGVEYDGAKFTITLPLVTMDKS